MISFDDDTLKYPKKRQRRSDLSVELHYKDAADFSKNVLGDFPNNSLADFPNASADTLDEKMNVTSNDNSTSSDIKNVIISALNDRNVNNNSLVTDIAAVNRDNNVTQNKAISKEALFDDSENFEDSFVLKSRKLNQLVDFDLPEVCSILFFLQKNKDLQNQYQRNFLGSHNLILTHSV